MVNRNKRYLKEDKGQASTLPMLAKCLNGIKKDNLSFSQLIGTDIYDIDYDSLGDEGTDEIMEANYEAFYREIYKSGDSYIYEFCDTGWNEIGLCDASYIDELIERLAIKDGVNYYKNTFGFVVVAYYNLHQDKLCLVPISKELASYIENVIDESDFNESVTLQTLLSEYSY